MYFDSRDNSVLETVCDECSGNGRTTYPPKWDEQPCQKCGGYGSVLTELGAQVIAMVQRRLAVEPRQP